MKACEILVKPAVMKADSVCFLCSRQSSLRFKQQWMPRSRGNSLSLGSNSGSDVLLKRFYFLQQGLGLGLQDVGLVYPKDTRVRVMCGVLCTGEGLCRKRDISRGISNLAAFQEDPQHKMGQPKP